MRFHHCFDCGLESRSSFFVNMKFNGRLTFAVAGVGERYVWGFCSAIAHFFYNGGKIYCVLLLLFRRIYIYLELWKPGRQTFYNFSQLPLSNSLTYVYCVACLCRFFLLVLWLGICVEVNVDRITILPPPPPRLPIFFPTHNFFFKTSDSYLKSARA